MLNLFFSLSLSIIIFLLRLAVHICRRYKEKKHSEFRGYVSSRDLVDTTAQHGVTSQMV